MGYGGAERFVGQTMENDRRDLILKYDDGSSSAGEPVDRAAPLQLGYQPRDSAFAGNAKVGAQLLNGWRDTIGSQPPDRIQARGLFSGEAGHRDRPVSA
jgi:hypothetical protein